MTPVSPQTGHKLAAGGDPPGSRSAPKEPHNVSNRLEILAPATVMDLAEVLKARGVPVLAHQWRDAIRQITEGGSWTVRDRAAGGRAICVGGLWPAFPQLSEDLCAWLVTVDHQVGPPGALFREIRSVLLQAGEGRVIWCPVLRPSGRRVARILGLEYGETIDGIELWRLDQTSAEKAEG